MNTLQPIMEEEIREQHEDETVLRGTAILKKGRSPFAYADICGDGESHKIKGRASFYYTPLGMLVCASVKGLGGKRGVYSLSIISDGAPACEAGIKCAIPPLYERNGYAWCSALTGKISPCEILGKRIVLRPLKRGVEGEEMAEGTVRCFAL